MFKINPELSKEGTVLLRAVERKYGKVPPHFKLFAAINPVRFKMFLVEIAYITDHPNIHPDFFVFLRRVISAKYDFAYCLHFNEEMLYSRGYTADLINDVEASSAALPLNKAHQALFAATLATMEDPNSFTKETIESLKQHGWCDADIFDALDHGAFLFKFSKLLKAYGA